MESKVVAIVGGGLAGLLACKYMLSKGNHSVVFESQDTIGGVWTKTMETTKLQTPKLYYQFADFPWPSSVEDMYPTGQQVLDYIQSYADHFDLVRHIRFNTKVTCIDYNGSTGEENWDLWGGTGDGFNNEGKWTLTVEDLQSHSVEKMQADFVILCLGRFSGLPDMPQFPQNEGPEVFHGKVIHSMEYASQDHQSAKEMIKGKQVTVVGFQKSALDVAMECSIVNGTENPCTVIYRTPHWNVIDHQPWGVPLVLLYVNRFAELMVHKPGEGPWLSLLATILSPIRWALAKFVESDLKHRMPLKKYGVVPEHGFLQEFNACLFSTFPEGFFDSVESGSIVLKRSPTFSFGKEGVVVEGEEKPIETDLVILATGFKGDQKLKNIFVSTKFQDYILAGSDNHCVPLYRECIHPKIPQVAMFGLSESYANLYTFEMRCRWLAELLDGTFKLPKVKDMQKNISDWEEFKRRYSGPYFRRSCIAGIHIWYNDQLCKDMGWNPKRKKGFFSELFEPYGPWDYARK